MIGAATGAGIAAALLTLSGPLLPGSGLEAQELAYTGGVQYSSSSYVFTETTTSFYLYGGLSYRLGRVEVAGSFPLVLQNSSAVSYLGGRPVPTGGPEHGALRGRRGDRRVDVAHRGSYELNLGDPLLRTSVEALRSRGLIRSLALDVQAKAPVADAETGIGTGEWDVGAGLSLVGGEGGTTWFADVAYWRYGDLPDLELEDGLAYGLGLGHAFPGGKVSLLGSVSGYTEIVDGVEPAVSLGILGGYRFSPDRSLGVGCAFGLTESAADIAVLIGWRIGLAGASSRGGAED